MNKKLRSFIANTTKVSFMLLIIYFVFISNRISTGSYEHSYFRDSLNKIDSIKTALDNEIDTLWISAAGDLMCHVAQLNDASAGNGKYDFFHMFEIIKPFTDLTHITFANLETVTAGASKNFTGYPTFNSPDEYVLAIVNAGFDALVTANNHCLDRGFYGIEKTIELLDECGIYHTGTFKNEEESNKILVIEQNKFRIALLAYTYGTNGIPVPKGKEFSVNYINLEKMKSDIEKAKETLSDKIVVFLHWGEEYQRYPNKHQKNIADELFDAGADIIFGSHPHVLQPMETRIIEKNENQKKVFIIYSLGNFISNQRKKYTDNGVIVNLQLIKNHRTKETVINIIDYVPVYVSTSGGKFRVIPVRESLYAIENEIKESRYYFPSDYPRLKSIWEESTEHLTNTDCEIYPAELMPDIE